MHSGISRRVLLRGLAAAAGVAGVGLTAGCDLLADPVVNLPEAAPELQALLAQTVALGDTYDATIARVPSLAAVLTAARDAHRAHAQALAQALGITVQVNATNAGGSGPTDPAGARAALIDAEAKAEAAARELCLTASPRLASLLGTIAAARACHQEALR